MAVDLILSLKWGRRKTSAIFPTGNRGALFIHFYTFIIYFPTYFYPRRQNNWKYISFMTRYKTRLCTVGRAIQVLYSSLCIWKVRIYYVRIYYIYDGCDSLVDWAVEYQSEGREFDSHSRPYIFPSRLYLLKQFKLTILVFCERRYFSDSF